MNRYTSITGSPPRVWGKLCPSAVICAAWRFTPTCVGKTILAFCAGSHPVVHPHVCGENFGSVLKRTGCVGSPPRVWGKHESGTTAFGYQRFTPTCVGKTGPQKLAPPMTRVHPHVCGENKNSEKRIAWEEGSPPRVWGKRYMLPRFNHHEGFTPTCVGKTCRLPLCSQSYAVHPHVCGENFDVALTPTFSKGSPPRVWGKQTTP